MPASQDPRTAGTADASCEPPNPLAKAIPWPVKLFGLLSLLSGAVVTVGMVLLIVLTAQGVLAGRLEVDTTVLLVVNVVLELALGVLYFLLGVRLLKNDRRRGALTARALMVLLVAELLVGAMLTGVSGDMLTSAVLIGIMVVLQSYLDPSLAEERQLMRKLRKLDERAAEEARLEHLRRAKGNEPYHLNFFNLFWTFVVCSVIGLLIETVYFYLAAGWYQNRTGMLFGPFSPIYGFGAVLMTLALNRIRDKNPLAIFFASALIGGALEYLVSWFLQYAFGITAWDYTGTFLSIDGRTNGRYMAFWGLLGLVWIRLLMPRVFKLVYRIPWDWRYGVTYAATVFMVVNGAMTLQAFDCWYERMDGQAPATPVQRFFANHFDNDYMANRFQTMSIDTGDAARVEEG